MKFHAQTTLVALAILLATLLLSSFLSIAAFERIYASALISTYEIAGKNLRQKIETSLKFSKPLDKFTGMDRLLVEVLAMSPQITSAGVADRGGRILYHTDPARVGERLRLSALAALPCDGGATRERDGVYATLMPLCRQGGAPAGLLQITFSRGPIYERLKTMAVQTLADFIPLLAAAALFLVVVLFFCLTLPLKRRLTRLSGWLEALGREDWGPLPAKTAPPPAGGEPEPSDRRYEPDRLALCLERFGRRARCTVARLSALAAEADALEKQVDALDRDVRQLFSPGGAALPTAEGDGGDASLTAKGDAS